jgi:hypothetical protein
MAKIIFILANLSEVEDFYTHFNSEKLKNDMGWDYSFMLCNPDTERPSDSDCEQIAKCSGLSQELIGEFSYSIGEFFLATCRDYENYELARDFVVIAAGNEADVEKLKVFSELRGFEGKIAEIAENELQLKNVYDLLEGYFEGNINEDQVWSRLFSNSTK